MRSERRWTESRLRATVRFRRVSSARYTSPMPPLPSRSPITKRPTVFPVRDPDTWLSAPCDEYSVMGKTRARYQLTRLAYRRTRINGIAASLRRRMLLYCPKAGKSGMECTHLLIIQRGCAELRRCFAEPESFRPCFRFNDLTKSCRSHNPTIRSEH